MAQYWLDRGGEGWADGTRSVPAPRPPRAGGHGTAPTLFPIRHSLPCQYNPGAARRTSPQGCQHGRIFSAVRIILSFTTWRKPSGGQGQESGVRSQGSAGRNRGEDPRTTLSPSG
jgi:hypothetical protein